MSTNHLRLVDLHKQKFPQTCYGLNEWRHYTSPGVWRPVAESLVRRALIALARREDIAATAPMISSSLSLLQDEVFVPAGKFDSNPEALALANGVLEVSSRTIREYRPEDYITSPLPYAYTPDANPAMWNRLLAGLPAEARSFLQEYLGYCLTPETKHELALWLVGPPRGGKSTFIDGVQTMLGDKSGVLGMDEIARSPFALSQIVGKRVIVCTEQPAELLKYAATYIRLISGEPTTINPKHLPAFEYRPHAKIISAMNDLPTIDNSSVGLFRRLAIVKWPSVSEEACDPTIKEQIRTQGPAILNFALEGLDRLRTRGRFELPESVKHARDTFQADNGGDVLAFLTANYTHDPDGRVQASTLYTDYELWCAMNDKEPVAVNKFSPLIDKWYRSVKPGNVKFWLGLAYQQGDSTPH